MGTTGEGGGGFSKIEQTNGNIINAVWLGTLKSYIVLIRLTNSKTAGAMATINFPRH